MTDTILSELIQRLYRSATGESPWSDFLTCYSHALHSTTTALVIHTGDRRANVAAGTGLDPHWQRLYEQHYASVNIWALRADTLFKPGVIGSGELAGITEEELTATEFYNDYLRPQDLFYSVGGTITRDHSKFSFLATLRPKRAGVYDEREHAFLQQLMPHLQTAVGVQYRLAGLAGRLLAVNDALDRIPWGIFLVSASSQILWRNAVAERILNRRDGLTDGKGDLTAANSADSRPLRCAIASAARTFEGGREPVGAFAISRPSGSRPFNVLVSPLPKPGFGDLRGATAIVFVDDPDHRPGSPEPLLACLFGLTAAESRMAAAIMQGTTVEEYAAQASVTLNTARSHLKQIFQKTDTRRQGDLIRRLLRSVAGLDTQV